MSVVVLPPVIGSPSQQNLVCSTTHLSPTPPTLARQSSRSPPLSVQRFRESQARRRSRSPPKSMQSGRDSLALPQITPPSSRPPSSRSSSISNATEHTDQLIAHGKEETWAVYDVFRLFSKGFQFKIERSSFFKGLSNCVTLKQLNVVKRTRLRERFRESAQDVTLEEFVRMYWPRTTEDNMTSLMRWCHLREAQVVLDGNEAGEESVTRTIFNLLDINGDGRVSVEELHHAEILTSEQTTKLLNLVRRRHDRLGAKALAAAALFGKVIDDCDFGQIFSSGCVEWDEKISYQDFCAVVKSRTNLDMLR